jgi:hypothetical protein
MGKGIRVNSKTGKAQDLMLIFVMCELYKILARFYKYFSEKPCYRPSSEKNRPKHLNIFNTDIHFRPIPYGRNKPGFGS